MLKKFNKKLAFSLLELVISISLLALIILYVIATFTKMLQSSTKGVDLTIGNFVAQSKLDIICQNIDNYNTGASAPIEQYLYASNSSKPTRFLFTYGIYNIYSTDSGNLYKVDVVVKWWKSKSDFDKSDTRKGYGLLVTKLSRLVYSPKY